MIKAISLWEPWASLIRTKAKTFETRSWYTTYRGPLLICASKAGISKHELHSYLNTGKFQQGLAPLLAESVHQRIGLKVQYHHLNFGKAVALVNLVSCRPTNSIPIEEIENELSFGNYSPGRFAWKLEMIRNDFEPFPVTGFQGLFDVNIDLPPIKVI